MLKASEQLLNTCWKMVCPYILIHFLYHSLEIGLRNHQLCHAVKLSTLSSCKIIVPIEFRLSSSKYWTMDLASLFLLDMAEESEIC